MRADKSSWSQSQGLRLLGAKKITRIVLGAGIPRKGSCTYVFISCIMCFVVYWSLDDHFSFVFTKKSCLWVSAENHLAVFLVRQATHTVWTCFLGLAQKSFGGNRGRQARQILVFIFWVFLWISVTLWSSKCIVFVLMEWLLL